MAPPFAVKEKGWGEFILEATFSFQSGERMKVKHPLLFEPDYQEKFYETKVLLDQSSLKIKKIPVVYEESFLRDFGDRLCSLTDAEMASIYELIQSFPEENQKFVFNCSEPDSSGRKSASLTFNLNSFTLSQLEQLCNLANFECKLASSLSREQSQEL